MAAKRESAMERRNREVREGFDFLTRQIASVEAAHATTGGLLKSLKPLLRDLEKRVADQASYQANSQPKSGVNSDDEMGA